MLQYFVECVEDTEAKSICLALDNIKRHIIAGDYSDSDLLDTFCSILFDKIQENAIREGNERKANAQYVFHHYFRLFILVSKYFSMLERKEFIESWNVLQDCLDETKYIGRFTSERYDLSDLVELLVDYESLYPYSIFASGEYVVSKAHCSICGKSMLDLSCPHIAGNVYWGKQAVEVIDEITQIKAISVVQHPRDKRCILTLADDTRTEEEKFYRLSNYLQLNLPRLQCFSIESKMETRERTEIPKVCANDLCPCGSGIKYKKCCSKKRFYKHERLIVTQKRTITLKLFSESQSEQSDR